MITISAVAFLMLLPLYYCLLCRLRDGHCSSDWTNLSPTSKAHGRRASSLGHFSKQVTAKSLIVSNSTVVRPSLSSNRICEYSNTSLFGFTIPTPTVSCNSNTPPAPYITSSTLQHPFCVSVLPRCGPYTHARTHSRTHARTRKRHTQVLRCPVSAVRIGEKIFLRS